MARELTSKFSDVLLDSQQTASALAQQLTQMHGLDSLDENVSNQSFSSGTSQVIESDRSFSANLAPNEVEIISFDFDDLREFRFQFFSQTGEIEIIDGFGGSRHRFLARQDSDPATRRVSNFVMGEAKILGDLVLLSVATELFAIDWLKLKRGENPVLWNLSIDSGERDQSSTAPAELWGENRMKSRRMNFGREKIIFAAPSSHGVCYLDGTNLTCLDPLTGELLWQRTNFQPRSILFGDNNTLVSWKGRSARMLDVVSGRQLKEASLDPELGAIWANRGIQLLLTNKIKLADLPENETTDVPSSSADPLSDEQEGETFEENPQHYRQTFGLYDLWSERFEWQREYPLHSKACLIETSKVAVVPPTGEIEFVRIDSGEIVFRTPLRLSEPGAFPHRRNWCRTDRREISDSLAKRT